MRGLGRIFQRGPVWWIAYSHHGKEIRESAKTTNEKEARKKLEKRLEEKREPSFIGPAEERLTMEDLKAKILADYRKHNLRSASSVTYRFKHLEKFFTFDRLVDITPARIERYQEARLAEGAERSTVNRELAHLRRGFKLLVEQRQMTRGPVIHLLDGENVREGFLGKGDFDKVIENLDAKVHAVVRDVLPFLYNSGWRSGEAKTLEWRDVDLAGHMVRLRRENSKNKKPRLLPLTGELLEIIERRLEERRLDCPFVFHRDGKPLRSFRKAWRTACAKIGQPKLVPHDMRRSAIRNFRKAGLSETEGMMLSGHKTSSVYKRYDIIDEEDLKQSMDQVQEHLKREAEQQKVVPIRRQA